MGQMLSAAQESDVFTLRVFSVGQGGFNLLTCDSAALFIDCGCGSGYGGLLAGPCTSHSNLVRSALTQVTTLGGVLSHQHRDHTCGANNIIHLVHQINAERQQGQ
jgi:metal-dependent hydrolase (beta-lactamase superfamily II)